MATNQGASNTLDSPQPSLESAGQEIAPFNPNPKKKQGGQQAENAHHRARRRLALARESSRVLALEEKIRDLADNMKKMIAKSEILDKECCRRGFVRPFHISADAIQQTDFMQRQIQRDTKKIEAKTRALCGNLEAVEATDTLLRIFTAELCGLPGYFYRAVLRSLDVSVDPITGATLVTPASLIQYYHTHMAGMATSDQDRRVFAALRRNPAAKCITPDDLRLVLEDLVLEHTLLQGVRHPATRTLYIDMVLTYIFHFVNHSRSMKITYTELCGSNLVDGLYKIQTTRPNTLEFFSTDTFTQLLVATGKFRGPEGTLSSDSILGIFRKCGVAMREQRLPAVLGELQHMRVSNAPLPAGRIYFCHYVHCFLHCQQIKRPGSTTFWLRCMDADGDGYLGQEDVEAQFDHKAMVLRQRAEYSQQHSKAGAWRIMRDAVLDSGRGDKISALDIKLARASAVVHSLLLSLRQPNTRGQQAALPGERCRWPSPPCSLTGRV
jgi:hypothetical protein